jgi:hypothetical protein
MPTGGRFIIGRTPEPGDRVNQSSSRWRVRVAALAAGTALLSPIAGAGTAHADDPDPLAFEITNAAPHFDATAYTQRLWGPTRYATSLAAVYYNTADAGSSSSNGSNGVFPGADRTERWFGPNDGDGDAIVVTAGDKFADSLAGASTWNWDTQWPDFQLADVDGNTDFVELDGASIVLTTSARQGATGLNAEAARAAQRYAAVGGDQAVILGGLSAVPVGVENELKSMGYAVFRIGAPNRFGTARDIAFAVGTGGGGELTCDENVQAGVLEHFTGPDIETQCAPMNKTVAIADGGTGADALSFSSLSSHNHVPVLLTAPDGSLPSETSQALTVLDVENVVVLGGTTRIPETTRSQIKTITGLGDANVIRVSGPTRYESSVEFAKQFAGYIPDLTTVPNEVTFSSSRFCFARSEGEGDNSLGWPDALGAGMTCAAQSGEYGDNHPDMTSAPIEGAAHNDGLGTDNFMFDHPWNDQTPLLLVQQGSVPAGVSSFLSGLFPATGAYCTGDVCTNQDDEVVSHGGWGILFGGPAAIATTTELSIATLLSGGTYTTAKQTDLKPTVDAAKSYYTQIDYSGGTISPLANTGGDHAICALRGAMSGVEFTGVYDDAGLTRFVEDDSMLDTASGGYQGTPVVSNPVCTGFDENESPTGDGIAAFVGDSLSDHFSATQVFNFGQSHRLSTPEAPASGAANPISASPSTQDANNGGTTTLSDTGTFGNIPFTLTVGTQAHAATASVTLTLVRPKDCADSDTDANACTFSGSFTITTSQGTVTGNVVGEASPDDNSATVASWQLDGMYTLTGGTLAGVTAGAKGGFITTWSTSSGATNTDDTIVATRWDGLAN